MSNLKTMKKDELLEMLEQTLKEKEQAELKANEQEQKFSSELENLKKMMEGLQTQSQPQVVVNNNEGGYVTIVSNLIGKNHINIDKDSTIFFPEAGQEEAVTVEECHSLLRFRNNKRLFVSGLLQFAEQEDYARFKIKPRRLLTDEYIIGLFGLSGEDFVKEVKEITENKTNDAVLHTLIHRMGLLYYRNKIEKISHEIMETFHEFFGVRLTDLNIEFLIEQDK